MRGYAEASGNVLFDGARPTSKRESIAQQLKRIPARAVARIELIHAGTPGVDTGGYPVVANVVRLQHASTEWTTEIGAIAGTDGWFEPQGQIEYGRRAEGRSLDLSLQYTPELDDDTGRGSITTRDPGSTQEEHADWDTRTTKRESQAIGSWRQPLASGTLSLTTALRREEARTRSLQQGLDTFERNREDERFAELEASARYARAFTAATSLEAMASIQRGWREGEEVSVEDDGQERFNEDTDSGETIARLDLSHAWNDRLSLTTGLESAYNFLDSDNRLLEDGVAVALPGAQVRVEEQRIEGSATITWNPAPAWSVEAGMRLERSALSQTGDTPLERRFTYPKPRMLLRWTPSETNQWRFGLSREVGQLDFEDFAASASLEGGTVSAGNAQLQPDQTWRGMIGWEHHFSEDAALTLSWTHDRISDVVDRVLVVDGDAVFDAPGNIGEGRRDTLALELSTPLDRLKLHGMRLRSSLLWRDSQVTDPVTGEHRTISEEKPFEGEIELSQELPGLQLNWGVLLEHLGERKTKYRYDRITRESEDMGWTLYAEKRLGDRWRLRAEMTDLFGRDFRETRTSYDGTRADGQADKIEVRNRESPGYISLTLRRSVGG